MKLYILKSCSSMGGSCAGYPQLSLTPNPVNNSQLVTPTVIGVSNCTGKTIVIKQTSCTGLTVSSCTAGASGCTGPNFLSPSVPGNYIYYSCMDKNSDGVYSSNEYSGRTLYVYNINESCSDSDGYNNQYTVGTINVVNNSGSFTFVDSCISSTQGTEYYCSLNKAYSYNTYCSNGCANGACVYVYGTSCNDPDGNDTLTAGTTTLSLSNGTNAQYFDFCSSYVNTSIREFYCQSNFTDASGTPQEEWGTPILYLDCQSGKTCQNGRCV